MSPARRTALLLAAVTVVAAVWAPVARAKPVPRASFVGTFQRMNRDLVQPDGTLKDVYRDLLVTPDRVLTLHLPPKTHVHGGTPVRVFGTLRGADVTADEVQQLGAATSVPTTGTTKTLVILAYWTAPDSVTTTQAKNQFFGDDNGWFKEASYNQLGLTGTATPWVKITGPAGGLCYTNHMEIMTRAKAAAKALGSTYDSAAYNRTVVYFPRCSGSDSAGTAGWAYEPGTEVWLNGYMDRRVSVHEMGHNYGLEHAHTYDCSVGSTRVTLGGSCSHDEYGDDYDAMGGAQYAAHYSAPMKNQLGWLAGRKKALSATETTFTLAPYETISTVNPAAAVAGTPTATRTYWMEYRQALGYDGTLPAGATGGVLVHMVDTAITPGPYLLDASPTTPFSEAVIPPGGAWTSPDGVRISVNAVNSGGASVTVKGGSPPATAPSVPRNVTATGGDGSVRLTWSPPASNNGATVSGYVVTRSGGQPAQVTGTSASFPGLANGTTYTFSVAAKNAAGTGPSASASATPAVQLPSVVLTSPTSGSTVTGEVALAATPTPNPVSNAAIENVDFTVDGEQVASAFAAPWTGTWDASWVADGVHTVVATAYDANGRYASSAPVQVTTKLPRPEVSIVAPADGSTVTQDLVTVRAAVTPAPGTTVDYVDFALDDGTYVGYATGPQYEATWDTSTLGGDRTLIATAWDSEGRSAKSAPVTVTIDHPMPSVVLTAPTEGANVQGSAVALAATVTPSADGSAIDHVEFYADGSTLVDYDYDAPYTATWDTSGLSGEHVLTARVVDAADHAATSPARTVLVTNPLPSAAVTAPAPYATVDGMVAFAATATPNASSQAPIAHVELEVDGFAIGGADAPGPYSAQWDSTGAYGQHSVVAVATDVNGQTGRSAPVPFTVPLPAPTAVVTSPADGANLRSGAHTITVSASPDAGTGAALSAAYLYVDGEWTDYDDTVTNGTFSIPWTATTGSHVLTAVVYDEWGYSGSAAPVAVTVADPPGVPTAVTATPGTDGTATVQWTAPASTGGSAITGYVVKTGAVTKVATSSPYSFTGLTNGASYTFSVAARNAVGDSAFSAATPAVVPGTRTSLTIAVTPTTVNHGTYVTVTGTLKRTDTNAVLGGKTVQLLACLKGTMTCSVVRSGPTSTAGAVRFTYAPPAHRDLRLRFLPASPLLGTTTGPKTVLIRVRLSSAVNKTQMTLGSTVTMTGAVTPAHYNKPVYLQRYYSGAWRNVTYRTQNTAGAVSFAIRPTARGTYTYRLYFPSDADHLGAYSPNRAVKVV